jgi:tetratricopeptide (TPR) repeat protein
MPKSITRNSLLDGLRVLLLLRGLHPPAGSRGPGLSRLDPQAVIRRLEPVRARNPRDWFVRLLLGSFYSQVRRHADELEVLKEAFAIRPTDPRSTYALATAYRELSWAHFEGGQLARSDADTAHILAENPSFAGLILSGSFDPDPIASADELQKIGLTADEVAEEAMYYFDETLRLGVHSKDTASVHRTLQKMCTDFPHLETKIEARREAQGTSFRKPRAGTDSLYAAAVAHYTRLNFLSNEPPRYRYELGEVIRLSQLAVASHPNGGDAYVLLACAYSLLDSMLPSSRLPRGFYMQWAGAVMHRWRNSRLSWLPSTEMRNIAYIIHAGIVRALACAVPIDPANPDQALAICEDRFLQMALSPSSFSTIKEQLQAEP